MTTKQEAVQARVAELRDLAEVVRAASVDTATYEAAERELEELKRGTVASRLGAVLATRRVKVGEVILDWDANGDGNIDKKEFRHQVIRRRALSPTLSLSPSLTLSETHTSASARSLPHF